MTTRTRWAGNGGRTSNADEAAVFARLEAQGCTVYKNGWPDALVIDGDGIPHLIEVRRPGRGLSGRKERMALALKKCLNIEVEVLHP